MSELWRDLALCAETDPEAFFPDVRDKGLEAKRICASCPVQRQCLDAALANGETDGIWAGYTARELKALPGFIPQPVIRESGVDYVELASLVRSGMTDEEVATRVHCHPKTVMRWRRQHGLKANRPGQSGVAA